jgi:hypothetical protein
LPGSTRGSDSRDDLLRAGCVDATSSWGGRRKRPLAFTEHGAIQAATILNSPRAVEMSVYVVRAFVKLESRLDRKFTEHDEAIAAILSAIRELMKPRDFREQRHTVRPTR